MWRKRTLHRLLRILRILCQVKRLPKTCVSDTRKTCLNQEFISYHVPTGRVGWITPLIWEIQYSLCFVRVCYCGRSCFSLNRRCFLTETQKIVREITAEWAVCDIFCQYFSIWCRKTMENWEKNKRCWGRLLEGSNPPRHQTEGDVYDIRHYTTPLSTYVFLILCHKSEAHWWPSCWASGCDAGGREFDSDRTNTQDLKITEEKVLPL